MRILKWILFLLCLLPGTLAAQDVPKIEIFGGYSHFSMPSGFSTGDYACTTEKASLNGWNATATVNFSRWIGMDADFGGYYGNARAVNMHRPNPPYDFKQDFNVHTYLFGPRLSYRGNHRIAPYIHALFGKAVLDRVPVSNTSKSSFVWAFGGGFDIRVDRRVAIRAIQADYIGSRLGISGENNLRLSTGAVLRF